MDLDETVAQVQTAGGQSHAYVADISSKLALQTMLNEIIDQYGHLDILVQAASVEPRDALLEIDEWDWRRMLDSNLTGPFLLMQSVGRIMREQGGGVMVNVVCVDGASRSAAAGKTGLLALTQVMANELGAYNIRVNALSCGAPEAEQLDGYPENPVDLVLYLCSGESSHVNGKVMLFDPGE
jgi:NAD(P)-dependent dehydrogenase (short-subunit alcohol dehydrogenase family)